MGNDTPAHARGEHRRLIVLGTVNLDHVIAVDHHPVPGETVVGDSYRIGTGGKGSNQAVAAARAGIAPNFVSAVGHDSAGKVLLRDLESKGVDTSYVTESRDLASGVALIAVSRGGENSIVVAAGAAAALDAEQTASTIESLATGGAVLLSQLELPLALVSAACLAAHAAGARVVLNLSPSQPVPEHLLSICDPVIVNAGEASALAQRTIDSIQAATEVARAISQRSQSVVVTLGGAGAVVADADGADHFPAKKVPVVDTTGAGDSFAGALAAALARGEPLRDAVHRGIEASADTVQHPGAQPPAR